MAVDTNAPSYVSLGTPAGRWVLFATVLGSGLAGIDATVVNIALPSLGKDLHASFASLQWAVNGYTLTLAALILLGGSLGDRYGRRRMFVAGVTWFALASLLCAVSPNISTLVAARALQGIGGALLAPGSLAMISASFAPGDRAKAIGAWSGFGGIATAIGPFVGGYLVTGPGWRWIFLINPPLALIVILVARKHVPETLDPDAVPHLDLLGAALGAIGLGGVTYALISAGSGATTTAVVSGVIGVAAFVGFVDTERKSHHPMLPPQIFANRQFTAANLVTFTVYAALGGVFFLLMVNLQIVAGFSALLAGTALLPVTAIMLVLSARASDLAAKIGPRLPMIAGPSLAGCGVLLMLRIGEGASYLTDVLPAVIVFGLGLCMIVAPLSSTVLGSADTRYAGVASGVNNAVARAAGLLAVAVLPVIAGISGDDYQHPAAFSSEFKTAMVCCAVVLFFGALISATVIRNPVGHAKLALPSRHHTCALSAPPVAATAAAAAASGRPAE